MTEASGSESTIHRLLARAGLAPSGEQGQKLGTYLGVFRPTILTILGVMLYLRQGWVVGNAGLLGGLGVLLLAFFITGCTALSVSTITTNIRLGTGGAFALVSQSLGLEAGGAIGLPLYLAQTLSAALYLYGFAEGWAFVFPDHPQWLVILSIYLFGFGLALVNVSLVFRLQILVFVGLIAAVISMVLGAWNVETLHSPEWIGSFEDGNFWQIFAVFFPAATGIMVGVSMSGQLKEPRRNIPVGLIAAWAGAFAVYALLMVWYAVVATPDELRSNYLVSMKYALSPMVVQVGLLLSTASAMLASLVAAPQVLYALGVHRLFPKSDFFTSVNKRGIYTNATLVTGGIVGLTLLVGDLNKIAALITMFYLITYATLNIVLLIEKSLAMVSFRPTMQVPIWVPALGATACVFAMVITAPGFGMIALAVVVSIYVYLASRQLDTPWETVRSGLFLALADWAAKKTKASNQRFERAWKPDVLIPIHDTTQLDGLFRFLRAIVYPKGSLQILAVNEPNKELSDKRLDAITDEFYAEDLFTTWAHVEASSTPAGVRTGASVLRGSIFRPNVLFVNARNHSADELQELLNIAREFEMGFAVLVPHPKAHLGHERRVNVWIRDQSPNWELGLRLANIDLTLLLAYQIHRSWKGQLRMLSIVSDEETVEDADFHLKKIYRDARIPGKDLSWVRAGRFNEMIGEAPRADINIFGLSYRVEMEQMEKLVEQTRGACLFVLDSGYESAFA